MRPAIFSSSLLLLSAVLVSTAAGTPIAPYRKGIGGKCKNPIQRKEWRTLSDYEKKCYIDAVKCLQQKPPITAKSSPGALSRFDDFQGVHILRGWAIHYVGQFLPWHRYYLNLYEKALREECGYKGGQPYWDWTLDIDDLSNSPIFDPITGFGGNGAPGPCSDTRICPPGGTGGGCVQDGPFKDQVVHMGPWNDTGTNRNDQCLKRNFNPIFPKEFISPAAMQNTFAQTTYNAFREALEGLQFSPTHVGPHGAGHIAVGGVMTDYFASPGDPLFFMHHTAIDRIWWIWQSQDLPSRLYQISGRVDFDPNSTVTTTLATKLDVGLLAPEITIGDVMDIQGGFLCSEYV